MAVAYDIVEVVEVADDLAIEQLLWRSYVDAGFTDPALAPSLFAAGAVRRRGRLFLAMANGESEIAGMVVAVPPTSPARRLATAEEMELHLLAVAVSRRNAGIGAALIDAVLRAAGEGAYRRVVLWTQPTMDAARRLHLRAGFAPNPARDWDRDGRAFHVYECKL